MNVENIPNSKQTETHKLSISELEPLASYTEIYQNGEHGTRFQEQALEKFAKIVHWEENQSLENWSEKILNELIPFVKGMQASFYYTKPDTEKLKFISSFAIDFTSNIPLEYAMGEGLVGQVARDQEPMILADAQEFASITSMRKIRLKCLILLPLVYQQKTIGLIEINFPQKPDPDYLNFLFLASKSIAASLHALLKAAERTRLLKQVRSEREQLQRWLSINEDIEGNVLLNEAREIVEVDPLWLQMFGYRAAELKGKKITEFFASTAEMHPLSQPQLENHLLEIQARKADGSTFPASILEKEWNREGGIFHLLSVKDISQSQEAKTSSQSQEATHAQPVAQLSEKITRQQKELVASQQYADRILSALLPGQGKIQEILSDFFLFIRPKEMGGGDFYWCARLEQEALIGVIDCTGHGTQGALVAMLGSTLLDRIVYQQGISSPADILTELNSLFSSLAATTNDKKDLFLENSMRVSICRIDKKERILEFAGAKQPLFYIQAGQAHEIHGDSLKIGGRKADASRNRIFTNHQIQLHPEQTTDFYLFTDGYEDQFGGPERRKFMRTPFRELLTGLHGLPVDQQLQTLENTMDQWQGEEIQVDDMLVFGFKL